MHRGFQRDAEVCPPTHSSVPGSGKAQGSAFAPALRSRERYLDPAPIALDRLDDRDWADALRHARDGLDPLWRNHRGRRTVVVTLLPPDRRVAMPVTPAPRVRDQTRHDIA